MAQQSVRHALGTDSFDAGHAPLSKRKGSAQEYVLTLRRHARAIMYFAIAGLLLGLLISIGSLPVYQTRTSLDIRSLNGDFMNMKSVAPTGNESGSDSDTNLQTQIKLLQSDTLIQDTVHRMLDEPHPALIERTDVISQVRRMLHLGAVQDIPYEAAVNDAALRLKVKPLGLTRLVEITCASWSPEVAARFCNLISIAFEEEDMQVRSGEASKVSSWLTRQVADVKQHAQDAQAQLETAVGGNGLMLSQTGASVGEDSLRSLQSELVRAEADRMAKEAEVGVNRAAAPGTQSNISQDASHRAYETRLVDLRGQLAASMPPLTKENPKIIRLRSQIQDAERGLEASETTNASRDTNELSAARHRESLLSITYNAQLARVSSDLQHAAKVSLLKSELDSEQHLYQTLLQRAKEAGFASAMQASTIRVVDAAKKPVEPFSPKRKTAAAAGTFLGALFGVGLAFYKERTLHVFRTPGDASQSLNVAELGVIPSTSYQLKFRDSLNPQTLLGSAMGRPSQSARADSHVLSCWSERFSLSAEAYRNATFSILNAELPKGVRTYVVSSPNAGEGKTTVTSNLGVALSKSKLRVVLIDGDLRKPNLHNTFSVLNTVGMRDVLRGDVDLASASLDDFVRQTAIPNLYVVPAGQGNEDTVELLHSPHFKQMLDLLAAQFDVALIDTPPTLHMVDTRVMARQADGVILIIRAEGTTLDEAINARDLFDRDGVHIVGTILNDFNPDREGKSDYYESYYRYYQDGAKQESTSTL